MRNNMHKKKRPLGKRIDCLPVRIFAAAVFFMVFALVLLPFYLVSCLHFEDKVSLKANTVNQFITLYRSRDGKTMTLELEAYVAGVVAGEMPAAFETEALKAQAVAARTYALSKTIRGAEVGNPDEHPLAPLCDSTHCQVYRNEEELAGLKGKTWMNGSWQKIRQAVSDTAGEVMYYEGTLVEQPLFHSSSGGKTENSEDVFVSALPYLRSVESPFEGEAPYQNERISVSVAAFDKMAKEKFGAVKINPNTIKIKSRSEGGRVKEIQVGDKILSGREIRDLLGLRSADFSLAFDGNDNIIFTTHGYGHGVGMSQWGANGMAKAGYSYKEILQHYYLGITVKQYGML